MTNKTIIRNVWCISTNYRDLIEELGISVPFEPVFFLKAGSAIVFEDQPIILPNFSNDVIYEIEIALQFNKNLQIGWAGLALELSAKDIMEKGKKSGKMFPWTLFKSFKCACPVGNLFPIEDLRTLENIDLELEVNGQLYQKGNTRNMVFSFQQMISYLLEHFPVCPGDLILTGSPGNRRQVKKGDRIIARLPSQHYEARWVVDEK